MPFKALLRIAGQPDIVLVRVAETLKGIDEATFHTRKGSNETANDDVVRVTSAFAAARLRRDTLRVACRAVAHATAFDSRERRLVDQTGVEPVTS